MEDLVITLADCRRHRYCCRGVRRTLERHGFAWKSFRRHGLPAEAVLMMDDAMAARLVEMVRRERGHA